MKTFLKITKLKLALSLFTPLVIGVITNYFASLVSDNPKYSYYFPLAMYKQNCGYIPDTVSCATGWDLTNIFLNVAILIIIYIIWALIIKK